MYGFYVSGEAPGGPTSNQVKLPGGSAEEGPHACGGAGGEGSSVRVLRAVAALGDSFVCVLRVLEILGGSFVRILRVWWRSGG